MMVTPTNKEILSTLPKIHFTYKGSRFRAGLETDQFTGKPVSVIECQEKKAKGARWLPIGTNGNCWVFETADEAQRVADLLNNWAVTVIIC